MDELIDVDGIFEIGMASTTKSFMYVPLRHDPATSSMKTRTRHCPSEVYVEDPTAVDEMRRRASEAAARSGPRSLTS